ncbi:MAG: hypothetical protein PHU42_00265 [Patescibacteria group bacterium]|nr:hypothetical protein [Patescibacteria group bacterium]
MQKQKISPRPSRAGQELTKKELLQEEKDKDIWWQDSRRNGRKAIAIIVVLVFILIAVGLVSVLFNQREKLSQKEIDKIRAEMELVKKDNQAELDILQTKLDAAQKKLDQAEEEKNRKVVIEGSLSYPGSVVPADMTVCAQDLKDAKNLVCTKEHITDKKYTYGVGYKLEVIPGSYNVYATVSGWQGYQAYYDEFVSCGMKYGCTSHTPIEVKAERGKNLDGIDPIDWYKQS